MSRLTRLLNAFRTNDKGSFTTLMSLGMVSMIGFTGLAVDYSRAIGTKAELAAAADSAALAAARTIGSANERERVALAVFKSNTHNMKHLAGIRVLPENIVKEGANYGYRVRANAEIKTMFGGLFGLDKVNMDILAEAIGTISSNTEIALVLDTTYSMTGWKIETLKIAATDLVQSLEKLSAKPEQLKFSIIPFSEYVNVGLANRNKPWMDVPADYQDPSKRVCHEEKPITGRTNCRMVNYPAVPGSPSHTCYNDGVPYSCGGRPPRPAHTAEVCNNTYGEPVQKCTIHQGAWHRWHGCVGSRKSPLDTVDDSYGNRIPGLMDTSCGSPVVELTSSMDLVRSNIRALKPNGETYIPAGLIWGWRTLSSKAPFEARAATEAEPARKYLILMTDGLNTRSATYPRHDGHEGEKANALTSQICANIAKDKASHIQIFSVAFDVKDSATKTMLKDCALNTKGQFFDARNAEQFLAAFSRIGNTIAELRLSR